MSLSAGPITLTARQAIPLITAPLKRVVQHTVNFQRCLAYHLFNVPAFLAMLSDKTVREHNLTWADSQVSCSKTDLRDILGRQKMTLNFLFMTQK